VRDLFKKENVLTSDWYAERLRNKQKIDAGRIEKIIANLEAFIANPVNGSLISEFKYDERLKKAMETLAHIQSDEYLEELKGTLGASDIA
jgi:hypothetical protein